MSKNELKSDSAAVIHADPSKGFFINMLTRDIGVVECVLDLIDNAVDKAVQSFELDVMEILEKDKLSKKATGAKVTIDMSAGDFVISDTCGGIAIKEARDEVFLFGNPDEHGSEKGLSVYGIGMKRAFFKLGREIRVRSWTESEHFQVDINVDEWEKKPKDWTFMFTTAEPRSEHRRKPGTEIRITALRDGIGERLGQRTFQNELREKVGAVYALFLMAGIEIVANEQKVEARLPTLATKTFTPARKHFKDKGVETLIIAGVTPKDDRNAHGWYVFCNGRMVLEADKTSLTGWGDNFPQFHSKYNHFLGFLYFGANNVQLLPWRTTKQGVDRESLVYRKALAEMKLQARPILNYLNDLYPGDQLAAEPERAALEQAESVRLDQLPKRQTIFSVRKQRTRDSDKIKIQYSRPRKIFDLVRRHLGKPDLSGTKVGEYTFDYFVEQELG